MFHGVELPRRDASIGGHLTSYRLYFLDPQSFRILGFEEIEAESDAAAIVQAEKRRGDKPMELWCRARKVQHWPAQFASPSNQAAESPSS
jgi:hypothetical protein